jgi:hypothetical protein
MIFKDHSRCAEPEGPTPLKDDVQGAGAASGIESKPERHRDLRSALFHLAMLTVGLAGFWIIGRDTATIAARPPMAAEKEHSRPVHEAEPGSFPAPPDLKGWTEALAACARSGPHVQSFVNSFPGGPAQKMAAIYAAVAREFRYEADGEQDWFTPAEILAQPGHMHGDCKQIATLLYASALDLGISARMIATGTTVSAPGHVHTEILLARPQEDPNETLEAMSAVWKAVEGRGASSRTDEIPLAWTAQGVFLILDGGMPPSKYQHELGPVQSIIESGPTDRRKKQ